MATESDLEQAKTDTPLALNKPRVQTLSLQLLKLMDERAWAPLKFISEQSWSAIYSAPTTE
jgi:hypothetical protein